MKNIITEEEFIKLIKDLKKEYDVEKTLYEQFCNYFKIENISDYNFKEYIKSLPIFMICFYLSHFVLMPKTLLEYIENEIDEEYIKIQYKCICDITENKKSLKSSFEVLIEHYKKNKERINNLERALEDRSDDSWVIISEVLERWCSKLIAGFSGIYQDEVEEFLFHTDKEPYTINLIEDSKEEYKWSIKYDLSDASKFYDFFMDDIKIELDRKKVKVQKNGMITDWDENNE